MYYNKKGKGRKTYKRKSYKGRGKKHGTKTIITKYRW